MVLSPRESAFVRRVLRRAPTSDDVTPRVMTSSSLSGEITFYWNDRRLIYIGDFSQSSVGLGKENCTFKFISVIVYIIGIFHQC